MTSAVATANAKSTKAFHHATAIPTAFYVLAWVFPMYVNVFKRESMDEHRNTAVNIDQAHQINVQEIEVQKNAGVDTPDGTSKGVSKKFERTL